MQLEYAKNSQCTFPNRFGTLSLSLLLLGLLGCSEASFSGGEKAAAPAAQVSKQKPTENAVSNDTAPTSIKIPCSNGLARVETSLVDSEKASVIIEGQFCDTFEKSDASKLTAFFVLDVSESMKINDPTVSGSCGRLDAAKAIVDKLTSEVGAEGELNVGLLRFDSVAGEPLVPESVQTFQSQLTPANFCEITKGATNYEAAFLATESALKGVEGQKVVYFVSDGLPTRLGTSSKMPLFTTTSQIQDAGVRAAEKLRQDVGDLTLNAIYLGSGATSSTLNPEEYLHKITGSENQVKLAVDADALAQEILEFETPSVATLDKKTLKGEISTEKSSPRTFKINSLERDPSEEGVWNFVSEPIEFSPSEGETYHTFTISINGSDGSRYEAVAVVKVDLNVK